MCKRIVIILILTVCCVALNGQVLTQFPADKNIVRGTLPCGAEYYLVHNEKNKGYADFALVQKNHLEPELSRQSLISPGGFSTNPYEFFSQKGVSGGQKGFVSSQDGSTVFNFRNVPCYDTAAADSTLLVLFDMMRSCPTEQAIVISGDIQTSVIEERLRMLSLTVDRLLPSPPTAPYQWKPSETLNVSSRANSMDCTSTISVTFHTQRISPEAMNSPLPLVSRMFASELGIILQNRLWRDFYKSEIPLTDFSFRYRSSARGLGDELCILNLKTSSSQLKTALSQLSFELGKLDASGATLEEYVDARERFLYEIGARKPRDNNNAYVNKCIRHYLYGASLASDKSLYDFFTNRRLPVNVELELFNNFVAALLSHTKAVDLSVSEPEPSLSKQQLENVFSLAWEKASADTTKSAAFAFRADTTRLATPKSRVKVKGTKQDIISGGEEWTFSNGMKVVFKKDESLSRIHFGMLLRSGITSVPRISAGEAGFVQDMPGLYRVAGMSAMEFNAMLRANGISLTSQVNLTDFRISATAPAAKLPLLLKSIAAFSSTRETDRDAFRYYKQCEALSLDTRRHSNAIIDEVEQSVLFADYKYKLTKDLSALGNDLPTRTETFLKSVFEKTDDGVIFITGNISAESLQKILSRYLGAFKTSGVITTKPKIKDPQAQGWRTRYFNSNVNAVKIRMSVRMPYTAQSALAFDVAKTAISKKLVSCLAPLGYYAKLESSVAFYPQECFSISIVCMPSDTEGLPYGISPARPNNVLNAIRKTLVEAAAESISKKDLKAYKEDCLNIYSERLGQPDGMMEAVFARSSFGKNTSSIKQETANSVSEASVANILKELVGGSRIETVISFQSPQ